MVRHQYKVTEPNQGRQFNLPYIPGDKLYSNKYKCILTDIDVASQYKVVQPLRTKKTLDIAEISTDILYKGFIDIPKVFQYSNGEEFKSKVIKFLEKHGVKMRRTVTKYKGHS